MAVDLKSQVAFAKSIYAALVSDMARGRPHVLAASLARDLKTIHSRIDSEGLGFVTTTLPTLGKAITQSFRTGILVLPHGFKTMRGTALPRLFGGLLKEVFREDGFLVTEPDIASITEVIQLCGLAYKLDQYEDCEIPYEFSRPVIEGFEAVEEELSTFRYPPINCAVSRLARVVVGKALSSFSKERVIPRHGPGAVATSERGVEKWDFKRKFLKVHNLFPYYDYFVVGRGHLFDELRWYKSLVPMDSATAKVVLVPKDSRGPRLISEEPLEIQYVQQGVWRELKNLLESHPLTRGHVNFTSQEVNQRLALRASRNERWATLDMKDASDRVSTVLVEQLFSLVPRLKDLLLAARSESTVLPGGKTIALHKFAPMGSAVCFPVESIVHFALAVAAIASAEGKTIQWARRRVFVYGDDLIVATQYVHHVLEAFPRYGLRFNEDKCFLHGPFRESCGMDAFLGRNIAPIRWRHTWPSSRDAISGLRFCAFGSMLFQHGYLCAAHLVWDRVEEMMGIKLPTVPLRMNVGYLSRQTYQPRAHTPHRVRNNRAFHRLEHQATSVCVREEKGDLKPWSRLLRFVLYKGKPSHGTLFSDGASMGAPTLPLRRSNARAVRRWMSFP